MIELNILEYLIEFSKTGSLLKASENLHLSQPSLTKAMKRLEEELGINIFERSKNHLSLNDNGYIVLDYAKRIRNTEENLMEFARQVKEKEEQVVLGMVAPGPLLYYHNLLKEKSKFGKYVCEIKGEEELLKRLYEGYYDILFLSKPIKKDGYSTTRVFKEHLFVSLPKEHFLANKKDGISFSDIDGQTFLADSSVGIWKNILHDKLKKSKIIYQEDKESLLEMKRHSSLCAFATDLSIKNNLVDNRINIPLKDEEASMSFYMMMKENYKPCFKEFFQFDPLA